MYVQVVTNLPIHTAGEPASRKRRPQDGGEARARQEVLEHEAAKAEEIAECRQRETAQLSTREWRARAGERGRKGLGARRSAACDCEMDTSERRRMVVWLGGYSGDRGIT